MQQEEQENLKTTETLYRCPKCQDREFIINGNSARPCECQELRRYERILEASGISQAFKQKTFKNFSADNKSNEIKIAKQTAMEYVMGFEEISKQVSNSIAFLGQVGSGKTHLSIAIANNLMKKLVPVLYMPYRDVITHLKQCITDEVNYQREIAKYKTASVLMVDDLYKGRISASDTNIMFEIINYRYLKGLPVVISSELNTDKILDIDEGIGSRIIQMCKGRLIELQGANLNHRLTS
ncbi:DNA replication protein DnaC [Anaerovirgula multivorans]|uniref:DNA replication protein DnaC n=1 Tax=Anaerovirgula multivorans TaxID=312168 RepID=A0A239AKQ8_9FIRM|nr:DNA replication protein DnaC [Anaerovirgula multivorans]